MSISYRADIDGLRAIAVLSVVAYHAHIHGFNGGFIGVDIFFVISGYLITGIIQSSILVEKFSITGFYKRRIHRIFPALFALLIVVNAVCVFLLLPSELISYARSLIASALSASNFQFFSESGYFDASASTKPLLHTWSLAVEEQFYILWPALLILAHRTKISTAAICTALGIISFGISIWTVAHNPSAAFYLLPSRAWELMIGGLLSINLLPPTMPALPRNILSAIGLLMIGYSVKFYSPATPFPGLAALFPCVGVALLLYCGSTGSTLVARILSLEPIRRLGLFSYSIYLWHWPVIVFFKLGLYQQLTPLNQLYIVVLSIVLGAVSFAVVEEPFRRWRPTAPNWASFASAGAAIAFASLAGALIISSQGFPDRFTPVERQLATYLTYDGNAAYRGGKCFMIGKPGEVFDAQDCLNPKNDEPSMLLLGDSHAADLWPGLSADVHNYALLQANFAGCKPLLSQIGTVECRHLTSAIFQDYLPSHHPDVLLLSARWRPQDLALLLPTLLYLKQYAARVVLIGPAPEYQAALPRLLVAADQLRNPAFADLHRVPEIWAVDDAMREIASEAGVTYVSLRSILCASTCRTLAGPTTPMDFDYGHFTVEGSKIVSNGILSEISRSSISN